MLRSLRRLLVTVAMALPLLTTRSEAQSDESRVTKAARGFAAFATTAALAGATVIDLDKRNLPTIALGVLTVGISQIEIKDEVGARLQIYFYNPTEEAVTIPVPTDTSFILVDSRGRRLSFLTLRFKQPLPKGATSLTVPGLERVNATALFNMSFTPDAEGTLKVSGAGAIRGVPMRDVPVPSVAPLPVTPPPIPPDTTRVRDNARGR